jgi:hypothetical protein
MCSREDDLVGSSDWGFVCETSCVCPGLDACEQRAGEPAGTVTSEVDARSFAAGYAEAVADFMGNHGDRGAFLLGYRAALAAVRETVVSGLPGTPGEAPCNCSEGEAFRLAAVRFSALAEASGDSGEGLPCWRAADVSPGAVS